MLFAFAQERLRRVFRIGCFNEEIVSQVLHIDYVLDFGTSSWSLGTGYPGN